MWVLSWFCSTCLYPKDLLHTPQVNTFSRPLEFPFLPRPPEGGDLVVAGGLACASLETRLRWRLK